MSIINNDRITENISLMFVCHGNICRSPMAEYIMKHIVDRHGLADRFLIRSSATSNEEVGNDVYPPARRVLRTNGIDCPARSAVRLKESDYGKYDLILYMDDYNGRNIRYIMGDPEAKIVKLGTFGLNGADISDPWYTDRFEQTYQEITLCCEELFGILREKLQ